MILSALKLWRRRRDRASRAADGTLALRGIGTPTYRQLLPTISAELRRARRYEHPLTLLVVSLGDRRPTHAWRAAPEVDDNAPWPRFSARLALFLLLGSLLRDTLRESDLVCYSPEHDVYVVLLTESAGAEARKMAWRIAKLFGGRTSTPLRVGAAVFPKDGFVIEELMEHALAVWNDAPITAGDPPADSDPALREIANA